MYVSLSVRESVCLYVGLSLFLNVCHHLIRMHVSLFLLVLCGEAGVFEPDEEDEPFDGGTSSSFCLALCVSLISLSHSLYVSLFLSMSLG